MIGFDATERGVLVIQGLAGVPIDAESFGRRAALIALGLDASAVVTAEASVVRARLVPPLSRARVPRNERERGVDIALRCEELSRLHSLG